jgi:hypothetical protein
MNLSAQNQITRGDSELDWFQRLPTQQSRATKEGSNPIPFDAWARRG